MKTTHTYHQHPVTKDVILKQSFTECRNPDHDEDYFYRIFVNGTDEELEITELPDDYLEIDRPDYFREPGEDYFS